MKPDIRVEVGMIRFLVGPDNRFTYQFRSNPAFFRFDEELAKKILNETNEYFIALCEKAEVIGEGVKVH